MDIVINNKDLLFIRVDRNEAMRLIKSLTQQMLSNDPNTGRDETYASNGVDFSISVKPIEDES